MSAKTNHYIEKLVNGVENSSFVVIVSSIRKPVTKLFDAFLRNGCSMGCLLLTNTAKHCFSHISRDLKVYDYFGTNIEKKSITDICEYTSSLECDDNTLFIDSLTPLFKLKSNATVCQVLLDLKKRSRKLICVLNKDCVSELCLESISQIANTIIEVTSATRNLFSVNIVHKKLNSRSVSVSYSNENFILDNDFKIRYCTLNIIGTHGTASTSEPLMKNLPFNLNLKDEEREAKCKLVMPYTKAQETNIGKVYYEPDKNDDIDEEDPDDDLDI